MSAYIEHYALNVSRVETVLSGKSDPEILRLWIFLPNIAAVYRNGKVTALRGQQDYSQYFLSSDSSFACKFTVNFSGEVDLP